VVKTYHTDYTSACGSNLIKDGILTDAAGYACAADTVPLDTAATGYIQYWQLDAFAQDTIIRVIDYTMWLGDSDLNSQLATNIQLEFWAKTSNDAFIFVDNVSFVGASIGSNNRSSVNGEKMVPANSVLRLYVNKTTSDSGSFIGLGTNEDPLGSIRATIEEQDALCALPVTNLIASDATETSATLTWTASSPNSDEYSVYRDGTLIGTVTEQSFIDTSAQLNTSYNYVVRNSNTALSCEGPDALLPLTISNATTTPTSFDFGEVLVNAFGTKTFVITNDSAGTPITVSSVTLSGTWASQYNITSGLDTCSNTALAVNASCSIDITFKPNSEGLKDATLAVDFDGAVVTTAMSLKGGLRPYLVKDTNLGAASASPQRITDVNGIVFYASSDGVHGTELWKSDGTVEGTVMVKDINVGSGNSVPQNLINSNGTLFFTADDGNSGIQLWKSNGEEADTTMVKGINPTGSPSVGSLTDVNGTIFFYATDGVDGNELWKSDGTEAGTVRVKNMSPFRGTRFDYTSNKSMINFNGTLFFSASVSTVGTSNVSLGMELYKSDGTEEGTVLVKNINPSAGNSDPSSFFILNGVLYFGAYHADYGMELWKSDGTEFGTVLVKDINTLTTSSSSFPTFFTNVNGTLFFRATTEDNRELWKSDGTDAGTTLVKDINPGIASSELRFLTNVNGTLFFNATNGVNGYQLWKSDGTDAGTTLVKDIDGYIFNPNNLTNLNGTLFYNTRGDGGAELWQSDGSSDGTFRVMDIYPGGVGSNPGDLTASADSLYFRAGDDVFGAELWRFSPTQTPPTISPIADQETYDNHTIEGLSFSISDQESVLNCSNVVATSGNSSLIVMFLSLMVLVSHVPLSLSPR
jgi:ELWxxDGT repeat protein